MWYIACMIRGMSVDEAIKQMKFLNKKGAKDVREVLEEAKELAVKEHNVEFPSNMWVGEYFSINIFVYFIREKQLSTLDPRLISFLWNLLLD